MSFILAFLALLPMLIMLLVGLYLIVASRRGNGRTFPACGACGYDLSGSVGSVPRCPECGADFKNVGITPPGGTRSKGMLIAGIVLMILPLSCVGGLLVLSIGRAVNVNQPPTAIPAPPPPMLPAGSDFQPLPMPDEGPKVAPIPSPSEEAKATPLISESGAAAELSPE